MRRSLATALAFAMLGASSAAAAAATIDPERNATTPSGWSWHPGRTAAQINEIRKSGLRLTDIEVESSSPYRFTGVFVRNQGVHGRQGGWWYDLSAKGAEKLTKDRRIVDLETYTVAGGQRKHAIVTVPNTGEAQKGWWWNYDLTVDQVTADINKHGLRLVDLNAYRVGKKLRFSYVGIANSGVDQREWWWYPELTTAEIQQRAEENGARVLDLEPIGSGKFAAVMVKSEGAFSLVHTGASAATLGKFVASQGVRVTDIDKLGKGFTAVTIDNATPETGRIRGLLRESNYAGGYFGAFAKAVGGQAFVTLAHSTPYQPMSVMKLVPHLYLMDRVDKGLNLDMTQIGWRRTHRDDPCPGENPTAKFTDSLRNVLTVGLRDSLNRAHESLLETYDPDVISEHVSKKMGLTSTKMFFGCPYPKKLDWKSSRTTLADMGQLFEGVDTRRYFTKNWQTTRDTFYALTWDWPTEWFRKVVTEEALLAGKVDRVDAFLAEMTFDAKGGSFDETKDGKIKSNEPRVLGRAFSYRVTLPFRQSSGTMLKRPFVGGFFVNDVMGLCDETAVRDKPVLFSPACNEWGRGQKAIFEDLTAELQRIPIREALKSF